MKGHLEPRIQSVKKIKTWFEVLEISGTLDLVWSLRRVDVY